MERVGHRLDDVFQRPARNRGIEGEDKKTAKHTHVSYEGPFRIRRKFLECTHRVALRAATNDQLRKHHWDAEKDDHRQVNQKECSTTVFTHLAGKTVDVAQANSRAGGSSDNAKFRTKAVAFFLFFCHIIVSFKV